MDEEDIITEAEEKAAHDELTEKLTEGLEKIRTQAMLLGAKAMCGTINDMIEVAMNKPGKRTLNDHRRLVKELQKFCKTAIDKEVETPTFGEEEENKDA